MLLWQELVDVRLHCMIRSGSGPFRVRLHSSHASGYIDLQTTQHHVLHPNMKDPNTLALLLWRSRMVLHPKNTNLETLILLLWRSRMVHHPKMKDLQTLIWVLWRSRMGCLVLCRHSTFPSLLSIGGFEQSSVWLPVAGNVISVERV